METQLLTRLEGLHTVESFAEEAGLTRDSALNLLCRLKKEGYVTSSGGGKQKRLYKVQARIQLPREPGMFDVLNRHSPMKLQPWYDHQVHGTYTEEDALLDAIETKNFRVLLVSLRLFNHITDWSRLYKEATKRNLWQQVGALYDVARLHMRVRRMPERYRQGHFAKHVYLISDYKTMEERFVRISKQWNVSIPFRDGDLQKVNL